MNERKYQIGEALYSLIDGNWDGNGFPDKVAAWPVHRITERFVYVRHTSSFGAYAGDETLYRFDRAELERDGYAYHRRLAERLRVRPSVDWPLMLVENGPGNALEAP